MTRRPDLAIWLDERRVAVMKDAGDGASVSYTEKRSMCLESDGPSSL